MSLNHYRFYQFYSNTFVAAAFAYLAYVFSDGLQSTHHMGATVGFLVVEIILFAGSRDTLQKYYTRTQQLLNSNHP
jgi:membrane protein DedA with SNARE-associated domain